MSQRKRLNREAFRRYIQEQTEPVEWLMEACGTAVDQPERFASGRQLSAWLGMTPREYSSGDRRKLGHINRQGNTQSV